MSEILELQPVPLDEEALEVAYQKFLSENKNQPGFGLRLAFKKVVREYVQAEFARYAALGQSGKRECNGV